MVLNKTDLMLPSMTLVKAKLMVHSDLTGKAKDIRFMFNPSELEFTRAVHWASDVGNRGSTLLPKVNFSGVEPYSITLQNLLFDTYEEKICVLEKYINNIKRGATAKGSLRTRPPVYILAWHARYFHCVITNLNYKLTMFLPNGTPVKAIVNISLQEVDSADFSSTRRANSTGEQDPRLNNTGGGRGKPGRGTSNFGRGASNPGSGAGNPSGASSPGGGAINFGRGASSPGGGAGNPSGVSSPGGGAGNPSGASSPGGGASSPGGGAGNPSGASNPGGGAGKPSGGAGNPSGGAGNSSGGADKPSGGARPSGGAGKPNM